MNLKKLETTKDLDVIFSFVNTDNPSILEAIVKNPVTPIEFLLEAFKNEDVFVAREALRSPIFPLELLENVIFNGYHKMLKIYAVRNSNVTEETLIKIIKLNSKDQSSSVINFIFENPNVTVKSLNALIEFYSVNYDINSSDLPTFKLLVMYTKDLEIIDLAVKNNLAIVFAASNENTSDYLLDYIVENNLNIESKSDKEYIMNQINKNKNSSSLTLKKLEKLQLG